MEDEELTLMHRLPRKVSMYNRNDVTHVMFYSDRDELTESFHGTLDWAVKEGGVVKLCTCPAEV